MRDKPRRHDPPMRDPAKRRNARRPGVMGRGGGCLARGMRRQKTRGRCCRPPAPVRFSGRMRLGGVGRTTWSARTGWLRRPGIETRMATRIRMRIGRGRRRWTRGGRDDGGRSGMYPAVTIPMRDQVRRRDAGRRRERRGPRDSRIATRTEDGRRAGRRWTGRDVPSHHDSDARSGEAPDAGRRRDRRGPGDSRIATKDAG